MKAQGLWACHLGPELGGQGYGQLKLALMNEKLGRNGLAPLDLRLPGARHRQRRDHRPLRHARAEGEVAEAAAERRDPLGLLDERADRRLRPPHLQDPRRAGRRRVGDQRREVVLVRRLRLDRAGASMRSPTRTTRTPYQRTSIFLVPDQDPGRGDRARHRCRRRRGRAATATCATPTCACPTARCSATRGGAFMIAQTRLSGGRVHHAMRTVGACQQALRPDVPAGGLAPTREGGSPTADGAGADRRQLDRATSSSACWCCAPPG